MEAQWTADIRARALIGNGSIVQSATPVAGASHLHDHSHHRDAHRDHEYQRVNPSFSGQR